MFKFTGDNAHLHIYVYIYRSSHQSCFIKKVFLRISQNLYPSFFFNQVLGLFSCELCKISKNTYIVARLFLDTAHTGTCLHCFIWPDKNLYPTSKDMSKLDIKALACALLVLLWVQSKQKRYQLPILWWRSC